MINLQAHAKEKQFVEVNVHVDKYTRVRIEAEIQFLKNM